MLLFSRVIFYLGPISHLRLPSHSPPGVPGRGTQCWPMGCLPGPAPECCLLPVGAPARRDTRSEGLPQQGREGSRAAAEGQTGQGAPPAGPAAAGRRQPRGQDARQGPGPPPAPKQTTAAPAAMATEPHPPPLPWRRGSTPPAVADAAACVARELRRGEEGGGER